MLLPRLVTREMQEENMTTKRELLLSAIYKTAACIKDSEIRETLCLLIKEYENENTKEIKQLKRRIKCDEYETNKCRKGKTT